MIYASLFAAAAFAADVPADAAQGGAGGSFTPILFMVLIFMAMYFLMIRPQQKKQKEHQSMLSAIQKGDKVQTNGGIIGKVTGVDPTELTVEIAPQIRVKVGRSFIARVIRGEGSTPVSMEKPAGKDKDKK